MWIPDELDTLRCGGIIDDPDERLDMTPEEHAAAIDTLRRDFQAAEKEIVRPSWETQSEGLWDAFEGVTVADTSSMVYRKIDRVAIIGAGRRNGKDRDFRIAQLAAAAGITVAEFDEALRRVDELISQAVAAAGEMLNAVIQTINDVYAPGLAAAWEEIQKLMEQYEYFNDDQEDDRHDGATVVLVTWLLPVPTLRQLYGQGVDYGGPGPSRLTLTRVTDDGLRRAETGL